MLYSTDNNYFGRINISSKGFDHKPQGNEIAGIKFNGMTISNDMLSTFISNGYCYCPTDRKLEKVKDSDYICIDVDDSTIEMNDYVSTLTDIPTIYYTTPSNGDVEKSMKKYGDDEHIYRFRLLYALDTPTTNATEYENAFRYITTTNNMSFVDFRRANQYYNGSCGCEIHQTDRIYTLPDDCKKRIEKEDESHKENDRERSETEPPRPVPKNKMTESIDKDVLDAFWNCKKYEDFLSWYNGVFGESNILRESVYRPSETDERKKECEGGYYCIPRRRIGWDKVSKTNIYGKWNDRQDRHTKLFTTGIILRKLNPTITPTDMLYEIVSILLQYYKLFDPDKSLKFTRKTILQIIESVYKADLTKELREIKHSSFKVSSEYCEKNRVSKREVVSQILSEKRMIDKEKKYSEIDYFFESNITWDNGKKVSLKQWVEILSENGIEISLRSFKRYLDDRGLSKKRKGKKKSVITKHNIYIHNTITIGDDTFLDTEDYDGIWDESDRRFLEIVLGVHETEDFNSKWRV